MGVHSLYRAALFGAAVHALAFPGPQPTDNAHAIVQDGGWTPRPTSAPEPRQVLRRQSDFGSSYLVAPDNICGYFDGKYSSWPRDAEHHIPRAWC